MYKRQGLECNSFLVKPWPYDEMSHPTNWTVSESIRFLEQRDRSQPFFLMTSFVRPHPPLDAPKDYLDFYMQMDLHEPAMGDWAHFEKERVQAGRMYDSPYGTDAVSYTHLGRFTVISCTSSGQFSAIKMIRRRRCYKYSFQLAQIQVPPHFLIVNIRGKIN